MPARKSVNTSWTVPAGAANTLASSGSDGTGMCSAAGAIAATATRRPRGARRLIKGAGERSDELYRHRSANHAAVEDAPVSAHFEIGDGAVKEAAIVPHHQIANAPAVGIDELRLRRVFQQFVEERPSLRFGHPKYVRGMVAEIKRLRARLGMGAHQWMVDRRVFSQFRRRTLGR